MYRMVNSLNYKHLHNVHAMMVLNSMVAIHSPFSYLLYFSLLPYSFSAGMGVCVCVCVCVCRWGGGGEGTYH